jgi:hypothetical protein
MKRPHQFDEAGASRIKVLVLPKPAPEHRLVLRPFGAFRPPSRRQRAYEHRPTSDAFYGAGNRRSLTRCCLMQCSKIKTRGSPVAPWDGSLIHGAAAISVSESLVSATPIGNHETATNPAPTNAGGRPTFNEERC